MRDVRWSIWCARLAKGRSCIEKPISSNEHICELCSQVVYKMVPVVANPLMGLNPVLKDGKIVFKGYFHGYGESFEDHDAEAIMGTHCRCTRDPKGGGEFRSKA